MTTTIDYHQLQTGDTLVQPDTEAPIATVLAVKVDDELTEATLRYLDDELPLDLGHYAGLTVTAEWVRGAAGRLTIADRHSAYGIATPAPVITEAPALKLTGNLVEGNEDDEARCTCSYPDPAVDPCGHSDTSAGCPEHDPDYEADDELDGWEAFDRDGICVEVNDQVLYEDDVYLVTEVYGRKVELTYYLDDVRHTRLVEAVDVEVVVEPSGELVCEICSDRPTPAGEEICDQCAAKVDAGLYAAPKGVA